MRPFSFSPAYPILVLLGSYLAATGLHAQGTLVSAVPPKNPEVAHGVEAALKGEVEKAERYFGEDAKKRPGGRPGGIDAAMAFTDPEFEFMQFGKLRFWLEKTAEDYPNDPEAFLLLADIALSEGRLLECSMLARHAVTLLAKFDAANPRRHPLEIHATKILASVAERRDRWEEAIRHLEQLGRWEPEQGEYPYRRGVALFRIGRKEEAVTALREAAANDRQILPPLVVLAQLAEFDGNSEEAARLLDEAIASQGENPRVLLAAADLHLKWNHMDKVRQLVERARTIDPLSIDVEMFLGILGLYDGNYEEAEKKFSGVLQAQPRNSRAQTGLALALSEQGEPSQSRRAFAIAKLNADRHPLSVDAQSTLAWVLVKAGSLEEAEKILKRQFDVGEMSSPAAYYLAVIYANRNRKDEAVHFLRSALSTNNNFPKRVAAKELLKQLTGQDEPE